MARKTEKADALDKHIGGRIREQRENLGLTQDELARRIGVSYQQIHKYERGSNRISAGRLGLVAEVLKVSVQDFYKAFAAAANENFPGEASDNRLCLEVARNFRRVANPRHQEALHLLVRILAN